MGATTPANPILFLLPPPPSQETTNIGGWIETHLRTTFYTCFVQTQVYCANTLLSSNQDVTNGCDGRKKKEEEERRKISKPRKIHTYQNHPSWNPHHAPLTSSVCTGQWAPWEMMFSWCNAWWTCALAIPLQWASVQRQDALTSKCQNKAADWHHCDCLRIIFILKTVSGTLPFPAGSFPKDSEHFYEKLSHFQTSGSACKGR